MGEPLFGRGESLEEGVVGGPWASTTLVVTSCTSAACNFSGTSLVNMEVFVVNPDAWMLQLRWPLDSEDGAADAAVKTAGSASRRVGIVGHESPVPARACVF